jgi:L-methionine (R)-S-oxide reductase
LPIVDIWLALKNRFPLSSTTMFSSVISSPSDTTDKKTLYSEIHRSLQAVLTGERDLIANLANSAALLFWSLPAVNWAGFYLLNERELVLGPFQGKIACVRIKLGQGVCGSAAERRQTFVVSNVHEFPGHIACDSASNSEIVVPIIKNDVLIGVLDIDSPEFARFDDNDRTELEKFVQILTAAIDPAGKPET